MCGINGILSRKNVNGIKERITNMNNSLFHRGPDAGGYSEIIPGKFVVGQRRLSIIDVDERSNQPMWTNDKDAVIVFNGEIYNYKELKRELKHKYRTESDTEVLLNGLKQYGIDFILKCNGMFGVAYYNCTENNLVLIRDRLGIKPLFYYKDKEHFIFSSEIKGILNSGLVKAEFFEDSIDEYLGNRYIREPFTFFKNIYQLPAGCYITLNKDFELNIKRYWDLPKNFNMDNNVDEDLIYSEFKMEVEKAIKRRMVADVPLGTYLSGGIDSSVISAVCSLNSNSPINTYTIGFPELNEFEYARKVAEKYETLHHEIIINSKDYFEQMKDLISYKDAPLGVPNEVPLAVMSKELKKNITVVLSGEGADELMGGYGKIFRAPFDYLNSNDNEKENFYYYFINRYEYVPRKIRDRYLKVSHSIRDKKDKKIRIEFEKYSNEENIFRFFHSYHVKGLLQRVDMTTMYASVEARVPFLDHELIEFSYEKVPYNLKLKWNSLETKNQAKKLLANEYSENLDTPKYLLRKLGLELLPEEVVTRKKMGFPVPLDIWFDDLKKMAQEVLKDSYWLNTELFEELICDCEKNNRSGQLLWMFINVEIFRKMYFEKEWRY